MACRFLEECIRPNTSRCIINHICFTDSYHYGNLSHEATVAKYKGTELGSYLDFDKMDKLIKARDKELRIQRLSHEIANNKPVTIEHVIRELCGDELMSRMREVIN